MNIYQAYIEALMLSIVAPTDEQSVMAQELATKAEAKLSNYDINLCRMGIETCMEYIRTYSE
jgi:hypothetical protein